MEDKQKLFYIYKHLIKYKKFHSLCHKIKNNIIINNIHMNVDCCYLTTIFGDGVIYTYSNLYNVIYKCGPDAFFNIVDYSYTIGHTLKICKNHVKEVRFYRRERIRPFDFFSKEKYGK